MTVNPGNLIHADRHGAVVVPSEVIPILNDSIHKLFASERLILDPAEKKEFSFDDFRKAWEDFEKSRI